MAEKKDIAAFGWTAVPRDQKTLLNGKPYINKPGPLLVKDLQWPQDDELVTRVQTYAKQELIEQTYNHSMRVYYFGLAILRQQFPEFEVTPATYALTCLLHDIGTTTKNLHATLLSFEFYGGMLALDLLRSYDSPKAQAESVAEAIIRHQDLGETGKISVLGQVIQLATVYDNMGGNPGIIHEDTQRDVCENFPRKGWSGCFSKTIKDENGLKPWAHTTALGEDEFPDGVKNNKLMEKYD